MSSVTRELRTERIQVPVTPSERAEIEARARELGSSQAELLRSGWRYFPMPRRVRP